MDNANRRPIKARNTRWATNIAIFLKNIGITPNQISIMSVIFAFFAAVAFVIVGKYEKPLSQIIILILASIFIQCRLLCNLFDGMVAVEGNVKSNSGEIFNDFPDRLADPLILIGTGYAISFITWGTILGWTAGVLAILTAYTRLLGVSAGTKQYFCGPMAKQHRMAIITIASLLSILEFLKTFKGYILFSALCIIVLGCTVTIFRRLILIIHELESKKND